MEGKKLKIAFFVDSYYPIIDGVSLVVNNYASLLAQKHDVTVFVPKSADKTYIDNFPYRVVRCKISPIRIGEYNISLPNMDKNLKKILKTEKFDIVHVHSPFTVGKFGIEYANKNNIPVIITCHSQFYQDFKRVTGSKILSEMLVSYIAKAFNNCNELWTMNPKLKELVRSYGFKGKVFIIPNGCDMDNSGIDEKKLKTLKSEIVKPEEKLITFVGRIYALKNIDFILRVCKKLKDKSFKFKMLFVGSGCEIEKYKKQCKKLGLENEVCFIGAINEREKLKYYYAASDLLFFPSAYDTDGLVKSEAAVFETPTIFLKDTIVASVIEDGKNGYIGENDTDKFADKIINLFADKAEYEVVCKNAKKTLYFTWQEIIDRAENEYLKVIELNFNKKDQKKRKLMIKKIKQSKKVKKDA